jgi:hypothetical protein
VSVVVQVTTLGEIIPGAHEVKVPIDDLMRLLEGHQEAPLQLTNVYQNGRMLKCLVWSSPATAARNLQTSR